MNGHGDCGLLFQQLSHGSMVYHLLTELLQLTLWEEMQRLVRYHCYFFAACLLTCYDAHYHYLHPLVFCLKIGMIPHTGWLNSNVAGLSKPCPSGIVLICNNAMLISPLESVHFKMCI